MFCMVRHQPTLARFASPQAFGRSQCPGPHCSKGCADISLVLSTHVPMFSAKHFPLGVSGHCSLGAPGYGYLGVPTVEQHPKEWSYLCANSSTSSNSSTPEEFKKVLVALALGAPRGSISRREHCKHHVALQQLTYGSPSLHSSVETKRKPESGTVV